MNRATPQTLELSRRLIAYEATTTAGGGSPAGAGGPGAFRVCDRLRPHLATYMGSVGFRALLARALVLAGAEAPWLRAVQVKADGSLEGADQPGGQVDPQEMAEGGVVLVAQVLALLVAFIGADLTLQMVREVWLQLPVGDFKLGGGDPK